MDRSESSVWWEVDREMSFEGGLVPGDPLSVNVGVDDLQPPRQLLLQLRLQLQPHSSQHDRLRHQSPAVAKSDHVAVTWIEVKVPWRSENGEASLDRGPMFEGVVSEIRLAGPERTGRVRKDQVRERPVHLGNVYLDVARLSCGWGSPAPARGGALGADDILGAAAVHSGTLGHGELIGPYGEVSPGEVRMAEG